MFSITKYTSNDYVSVKNYMTQLYQSDATTHGITDEQINQTLDYVLTPNAICDLWVIKEKEVVVGYGLISWMYSNEVSGLVIFIEEIYVDHAYQGLGIGALYFSFIQDHYNEAKRFRLEVTKQNEKAHAWYKSLGFSEIEYIQLAKDGLSNV